MFLSIVVRFIFCQLTKNLNDEKQFQEFRYFSFAGFIGFLIALGINEVLSLPNLAIVAIWMILFVITELLGKAFHFSNWFKA